MQRLGEGMNSNSNVTYTATKEITEVTTLDSGEFTSTNRYKLELMAIKLIIQFVSVSIFVLLIRCLIFIRKTIGF